eukprot:2891076-Prymnesium_polylepis.2
MKFIAAAATSLGADGLTKEAAAAATTAEAEAEAEAEAVVARLDACRTINHCLAFRNAMLVFSGMVVLITSLTTYDNAKEDLLHMQVAVHAAPCAVATPSSRGILNGIGKPGFVWSPMLEPKTERDATIIIETSMCESSNVYMAIASLLDNSTMIHHSDANSKPATYTGAESDLVENLCNRRDPEKDIYGEIRRRIATAYVLANPAFRRYTAGCMGASDPFTSVAVGCTYALSVVRPELLRAANDTAISGYGVLPPVGHMLYRLLALSTIAEHDRSQNKNLCFSNWLSKDATELCQEIYESTRASDYYGHPTPPAAPSTIGSETTHGYEAV